MRLAVLSDIHGNLTALNAVLADLEAAGGADVRWVLGDLAFMGVEPAACIRAVKDLPEVKVIRGNTDRELVQGARSKMPLKEENFAEFAAQLRERDLSHAWTIEQMAWADAEYLLKLPPELSMPVEGYGQVSAFHAAPGDDEKGLLPDQPAHEVLDALLDREGRLAFCGHTHLPMDRDLGRWRVVNPGSIGMPFDGDQRAGYAIVTFENGSASLDLRRVPYDVEGEIARVQASDHPAREKIADRLRRAGK